MERKKSIISSWIITVSSYKNKENTILQNQIDSLVNVAKVYHGTDTTFVLAHYLPTKTLVTSSKIKEIIMIHTLVVMIIILFIFLYIRGTTSSEASNGEKRGSVFDRINRNKRN